MSGDPPLAPYLVALALGLLLVVPTQLGAREALERPVLDGLEPAIREQLEAARRDLDTVLAGEAQDAAKAGAFGALGQLYLVYELGPPAKTCFENAGRLAPEDPRWPYYLGVLAQNARRFDEAATAFTTVLSIVPDDATARLRLGQVELARNRPAAAGAAFEQARTAGPELEAAARAGLGRVAAAQGDHTRAARHLEAALALQPQADALRFHLAMAYRELGDRERAREQLRHRGDTEPMFPDPRSQALVGLTRGASFALVLGNRALRAGRTEAAIAHYRRAVAAAPEHVPAHQALAKALTQAGRTAEAIDQYRKTIQLAPENALLRYNLGTLLGEQGDDDGAIELLREAIAIEPDYPSAHFNLATALARRDQLEDAVGHFERVVALEPDDVGARRQLAVAWARLKRWPAARALLVPLVDQAPENADLRLDLARVLLGAGDAAEASRALAPLLDGAPGTAPEEAVSLQFDISKQLAQAGAFALAAEGFGQAAHHATQDEGTHFGHVLAWLLAGRYDDAAVAIASARTALPDRPALAHLEARFLATCPDAAHRDGTRALALAKRLHAARPTAEHTETVAMALAELGRFEEAVTWQKRLLDQLPAADPASHAAPLARLEGYRRGEPSRAPWRVD